MVRKKFLDETFNMRTKEAMELNMWKPKKRHFRETDEWRRKKSRIISKMKALSRINLLLMLSKMQILAHGSYFERYFKVGEGVRKPSQLCVDGCKGGVGGSGCMTAERLFEDEFGTEAQVPKNFQQ
ncbi:hypothetical protein OSTOST_09280, partial [Ostertagia ostertagi]